MRLVCISDTHFYPLGVEIPDGDVLIHAGDLTYMGRFKEIVVAGAALQALPHKHKIVIPGNHDFLFEKDSTTARMAIGEGFSGIQVLIDQMTVIDGKIFWGSPWSSEFNDWAFQARAGGHSRAVFDRIPEGIDVLISHGPPLGIRDKVGLNGSPLGNKDLLRRVGEVNPKLHVFGHIHDGHGTSVIGETTFVNAAMCSEEYKHVNLPIVVDLP